MKLWLDDVRPMPPEYDIAVTTADEAIKWLETGQVTEISLDHDLGDEVKTGYTVASWLELEAYHGNVPRLIWHIHSANPVGRQNMTAALTNADRYWDQNA